MNNEVEYEALLAGLRIIDEMEIKILAIFVDSQLIVNQVKGLFEAMQPAKKQYLERLKKSLKNFDTYSMEHIRRNQNKKADTLGKLASMNFEHLTKEVLVEVLANKSINDKKVSTIAVEKGEYWMIPFYKPSPEGYRKTIELPDGNNVVPLQSDTIQLVQNGCSLHGLWSEDPNQHLKDFLKLVDSLDLDVANRERMHLQSWELLEDLALYENESWNDPRDFAKPVKAISLPQNAPSTSSHRLIKFKNQVQRLMEAHLALNPPDQVNNIGFFMYDLEWPHDSQYCLENPCTLLLNTHPAPYKWNVGGSRLVSSFMASQDARLSKFEADFKHQQGEMTNKIDTFLKGPSMMNDENTPLFPPSSNTQFGCTKENDGDMMFVELIKKYDDSSEEELEVNENEVIKEELGVDSTTMDYVENKLEPREDPEDPRLLQEVLEITFVEVSNMTHDSSIRVVKFTIGDDEIAL
ncbi:MAK10-like protein [Tanacetum coccineum]